MRIPRSASLIIAVAMVFGIGLLAGDRFFFDRDDPAVRDPALEAGTWLPSGRALTEFRLTGTNGQAVDRQSFKDHWTLIFMGFTHCGDVCPATLNTLQLVSGQLAAPPRILFVSVDPNRDTPEIIDAYLRGFGSGMIGATGAPEELDRLAGALGVRHAVSTADGRYTVEHSGAVFLIDPRAEFRALFSPPHDIRTLAKDLEKIIPRGLSPKGEDASAG